MVYTNHQESNILSHKRERDREERERRERYRDRDYVKGIGKQG